MIPISLDYWCLFLARLSYYSEGQEKHAFPNANRWDVVFSFFRVSLFAWLPPCVSVHPLLESWIPYFYTDLQPVCSVWSLGFDSSDRTEAEVINAT